MDDMDDMDWVKERKVIELHYLGRYSRQWNIILCTTCSTGWPYRYMIMFEKLQMSFLPTR